MSNKSLNNVAQQYAEMTFMQEFDKYMKNKDVDAFKKDFRTLYNKVIIPIISSEFIDSTKSREHLANWEVLMKELVGEDGPGSVRTAIEQLKLERDAYLQEVKELRANVSMLKDSIRGVRGFLLEQPITTGLSELYASLNYAVKQSK